MLAVLLEKWYQVLSRQIFNPDYALFTPLLLTALLSTLTELRRSTLNIYCSSSLSEELLARPFMTTSFWIAILSRAVYKRILGKSVSVKDMETLDLDYYKSLVWMLENDMTDMYH